MILGIDLGTTNSAASMWDGRAARMIELGEGINTILPSVITIIPPDEDHPDGQVKVGQDAVEAGRMHPDFCFRHFKRRLAENWHDEEDTGHQTCEGPDGLTHYRGPGNFTFSPIELTSWLIGALIDAANKRLKPLESVTGAVICVPADFTQSQREAVEEAARMAFADGRHDNPRIELMHEPTAAALAYGYDAKKARRIAVFDLGGGTFDISIVQTGGGLVDVLTTNGIRDLGGTDFDRRVSDYVVNLWRTENHDELGSGELHDIAAQDAAMIRIRVEAEETKKRLSDRESTEFRVLNVAKTKAGKPRHANYPLDQRTFEELTRDLRDRLSIACKAAIADARRNDPNFSVRDLHDVLLVGGMTRVPSVRSAVAEFFGRSPKRDEAPEQVVAMGAAIRGAIIDGRKPDITIADITSHTIALETVGGVAAVLFPKGTNYPAEETFWIANENDDQKQLSIRLIQGEAHRASVCEVLWSEEVPVEAAPAGEARRALVVRLDASGRPTAECDGRSFERVAA